MLREPAYSNLLKEKTHKKILELRGTLLVVAVLVNHTAKAGDIAHERNATDRLSY